MHSVVATTLAFWAFLTAIDWKLEPGKAWEMLVSSPDLIWCVYHFQYIAREKKVIDTGVGFGSGTETREMQWMCVACLALGNLIVYKCIQVFTNCKHQTI